MIEITKVQEKHVEGLKKMMTMEGLDFNEVSLCLDTLYVVVERKEILGFGYFNVYDERVFIDNLYIKASERLNKLGDSLFRAILNALYSMSLVQVYMRNNDLYHDFLIKEDILLNRATNEFEIDVVEFFNRKCRGSKVLQGQLN